MHRPSHHDSVYAAHSHHHFVTNITLMCIQEGLVCPVTKCQKPGCGHAVAAVVFLGTQYMRCTKKSCRYRGRDTFSCYFTHYNRLEEGNRTELELALCFAWGSARI